MKKVSVNVKRKPSVVADKRMPIFLQLICNRRVKRIVLELQVSEKEWQQETQTVSIPPNTENKRIAELMQIRETLGKEMKTVEAITQNLCEKADCSVEKIVQKYRESKQYTFWLAYIRQAIKKKQTERSAATARNYQSACNAFLKFLGGQDLPIDNVDEALLEKFGKYLLDKGISRNTIASYFRNLKAVWNMAVKDHIIEAQPSPFRNISTSIEKTEKRAISEKYIRKLETLDLKNAPGLTLARDLFLFCFLVRGMTFVDLAYLTPANIQGKYLIYVRRKTGQKLKVELLPAMLKIIRKYQTPDQYYLFPILKNKEVSWKEYDSALRLQNKRLKILGDQIGIHLSTYVARHSWASIAKQKGIPEEVISDCMGHTSVRTTRIYICSLDNSKLDKANRKVIMRKEPYKSFEDKQIL